jgi:hypothetical protein
MDKLKEIHDLTRHVAGETRFSDWRLTRVWAPATLLLDRFL